MIELFDTGGLSEAEVSRLLAYVEAHVVDVDLIDHVWLQKNHDRIVLDLKSGVTRYLPWPRPH